MTLAEDGIIRMPTLPPTPEEVARTHGINADILANGTKVHEIDRFVEDYMTFAYDLPERAQDRVRTALTVGRILALAYRAQTPAEAGLTIDPSFYDSADLPAIARAWIVANDMHEGTLLSKGPDDEIRIVLAPDSLNRLLPMYPDFRHAVLNPGSPLWLRPVPDADTHLLITTPRKAIEAIASPDKLVYT